MKTAGGPSLNNRVIISCYVKFSTIRLFNIFRTRILDVVLVVVRATGTWLLPANDELGVCRIYRIRKRLPFRRILHNYCITVSNQPQSYGNLMEQG